MKKLLATMGWMFALSVAFVGITASAVGLVFLPGTKLIDISVGLASMALCSKAIEQIGATASEAPFALRVDYHRVRNWWRRRAWRAIAALLAGQSTAASRAPVAAYR